MRQIIDELGLLTTDQIKLDLYNYIKRENLDLQVNFAFSRKSFSEFMEK